MSKKVLYLECFSGISGDMTVGALLDLGADPEELKQSLDSLHVDGYEIAASEFYQAYKNWASTNNEYDVGNVEFGKRMKKKFESKTSNGVKYMGVKIRVDSRMNFIGN